MEDKKVRKGLFGWIAGHKLLSAVIGTALAAGIAVGVLFATGVFGGSKVKINDSWLREQLAADDTRVIELNKSIKSKGVYEVNGTKTLKGTGKITLNENAGFVLSINDGATLTMDGIEINVKNIGTNAVIVRAGGTLIWDSGTVSYPKQYSIMNYGDTTINGGTFEYAGASWVYVKKGTTVNVTGGNFVKSTTAGFEVEKRATLKVSGDPWMERAGTNTINNNGTVVMTGGTISQSEVWTITNHGSLDMKNVTVKDCALKGAVYNYPEASKCEIDSCVFSGSKTYQIYNAGEATVRNTVMEKSGASTVNNHNKITLENCQILNSNYHGIYNERGTINIKDLTVDGTVYKAVQNKAGFVTIDGLTTDNIGGTAVGNVAVVAGGDYGWIKAKNMNLSGATQYNLVSYGGSVEVSDSTFNISVGTNIYVRNGEGYFENVKVYGSSTPGKATVCGGSPDWRGSVLVIAGDDTLITGGSRGVSNYGELTLLGGLITGNRSSGEHIVGAGVYNVGKFTMKGGVIRGNESQSYGGGVRNGTSSDDDGTKHYGQMYMYGGEITGNHAGDNGGGISIGAEKCGLYMYGGTVAGNTCNGKGDGILVAGTFELHDGVIEDNEVFLFAKKDRISVMGETLSGDRPIEVTSNAWTNVGANHAVHFESSSARAALSGRFACANDQWSFESGGQYIDAVMTHRDISYKDDFAGAEEVTVTDFEALKAEIEGTERGAKKIIRIGASFDLEGNITLPYNVQIKLTDDGTSRTLRRSGDFRGVLFSVRKASTLVLSGEKGLAIDGNAGHVTAKAPMIKMIWGGTFVLQSGGTLRNAYNSAYPTGDRAGAVNAYGGRFIMTGGTIADCGAKAADSNGKDQNLAAVYVATSSVFSIKGGSITGCNNGAVRSYGRVYMSGGTVSGNRRVGDGGTGFRACNMIMTGGTIRNNFSSNSGCAIYITPSEAYPTAYFRMSGGTITGNTSSRDTDKGASAGAVYIAQKANAYFNSGTISDNVAGKGDGAVAEGFGRHGGQSGAGIYNEGTARIEKGMKITGNVAYNSGGGIYSNGKLYINGATITDNESIGVYKGYGGGGAIMLTGESYTEIKGATISNNRSGSSGTIYIDSKAELVMSGVVMEGNVATGKSYSGYNSGSAILNKNRLTVDNCTFKNNVAGAKAALYTDAGSATYITNSSFTGNTAEGAGAIANTSGYMEIKNTVFDGNSCRGESRYSNGGAVMNQRKDESYKGGELIVDSCTFTGNTAYQRTAGGGGYGGAIYNDYGRLTVKNSRFSGNVAGNSGKDILNSSNSEGLTLSGTLDAEELYFNVTKTVRLTDDFKAARPMDTIFNTYANGKKVLSGKASVLEANATETGNTFKLRTTSSSTSDGKTTYTVIAKTGYAIGTDGVLNGYAACIISEGGTDYYWSLSAAISAATGRTVTLLRDVEEDLNVPAGQTVSIDGNQKITGKVTVDGTLNLKDVTVSGGAAVSGTLGLDGAAAVTDGLVDLGSTGQVRLNGPLTAQTAAVLGGDLAVGRQVLTGELSTDNIAAIDLTGDGEMQISAEGKLVTAANVAVIVETGESYDTLADAVAAAQGGQTIALMSKVSAGSGVTVDKDLTITSSDARFSISGTLTVAAGRTLTLSGDVTAGTVSLGGKDAKLGFDGTLSQSRVATLDATALGGLDKLAADGTVLLAGNIKENYDKLTLVGAGTKYMLTTEGKIADYFEARIGGTYYQRLEDAVAAAAAGDVIELVNNVELEKTLVIDKAVTLTTDGVKDRTVTTISQSSEDYMINVKAAASIGGTGEGSMLVLDGRGVSYSRPVLCIQSEGVKPAFLTVTGSRTDYNGGGVYINVGGVTFESCVFTGNESGGNGGALYGNTTGLVFNNCTFSGNTAMSGGAVYIANESLTKFNACTFEGNKATVRSANAGGAVRLPALGSAEFTDCAFKSNSSAGYGGVFAGTGSSENKTGSRFTCVNCTFENNHSDDVAGVAYMSQSGGTYPAVFTAIGCTFTGNTAAGNGGVIRATGGYVIEDCTFVGNSGKDVDVSANANTYPAVTVGGKTYNCKYIGGSTFDSTRSEAVSGSWTDNGDNTFVADRVAAVDEKTYTSLAEAIAEADGEVIVLLMDISEDVSVPAGTTVNITGAFAINGAVTVDGTLNITDTTLASGATVSGTLGLGGAAAVTGGSADIGETGVISVRSALTAQRAAVIGGTLTDGRQVLVGELSAEAIAKFDLEGDGSLQIDENGKVTAASDTVEIVETGVKYDSLAEAVSAAQAGQTVKVLGRLSAGTDLVIDKDITLTADDAKFAVSGKVTVAAGKTLTLSGAVTVETIALGGEGAKVGFAGALTAETAASLDVSALGELSALMNAGTVVLAGDMGSNYDKLTLAGGGEDYMLTAEGKIAGYFEARIGTVYYSTLEKAVAAATAGDTIELVSNVELEKTLVLSSGARLTTDGVKDRTITTTAQSTDDYMINIKEAASYIGGASADSRLILDGRGVAYNKPVLCVQCEGEEIRWLTVTGSRTTYTGGGVYINVGNTTFTDCRFIGNTSTGDNGGAVYGNKDGLAFVRCEFEGNTAVCGGAVYVANACTTSFKDCTFRNNASTSEGTYGGGVMRLPATGTATFDGCEFTGNTSKGWGAVFAGAGSTENQTGTKFICTNCVFSENHSDDVGGVAYMSMSGNTYPAIFAAFNSTFTGNSSMNKGAAVRATGGYVIVDCTFTENTAADTYVSTGNENEYEPVTINGTQYAARYISGSTFDKTKAKSVSGPYTDGGGNTFAPEPTKVIAKIGTAEYTSLEAAYEAAEAGATIVLVADAELGLTLITEKDLTITTDGSPRTVTYPGRTGNAYMIYSKSGVLTLAGTGEDGRLIIDGTGSADTTRPALTFQTSGSSASYVTVKNSVNSSDGGYGGAVYVNKKNVTFENCIFSDNKSLGTSGNNGGALRISASGGVTLTGCKFTGNYSETYGGAIMVASGSSGTVGELELIDCTISGNESKLVGGAIYGNQSSGKGSLITASGTVFENNKAGGNGGAIRTTGCIDISGCTFTGNVSTDADISVSDAEGFDRSVSGCVFDKAFSEAYGGAPGTIRLGDGTTDDNTYNSGAPVTVDEPTVRSGFESFAYNGGSYGPADVLDGFDSDLMNAAITLDSTVVTAIKEQGVYTLTVTPGDNVEFSSGKTEVVLTVTVTAPDGYVAKIGSTQYVSIAEAVEAATEGSTIVITADSTITSQLVINKQVTITTDGVADRKILVDPAFTTGWAIDVSTAKVTIAGSESSRLIIDGQNTVRTRGLLYVHTGKGAEVRYVTVQNGVSNGTSNNGVGGAYISTGTDVAGETCFENVIIRDCKGTVGHGGGLTVNTKNVLVKNCTFMNNESKRNGGGFYQPSQSNTANYGGCVLEGCVFSGNTAEGQGTNAYIGLTVANVKDCRFAESDASLVCLGTSSGNEFNCDLTGVLPE